MLTTSLVLATALLSGATTPPDFAAEVVAADGAVLWWEESADRIELERRAWLAVRLLGGATVALRCADEDASDADLRATAEWSALVDDDWHVEVGPEAKASLARAMEASGFAPSPDHVETDGAMAICNRCGSAWIPTPSPAAGPVTWGRLRVRLARFLEGHRPCGIARRDGRIGLAPEGSGPPAPTPPVLVAMFLGPLP